MSHVVRIIEKFGTQEKLAEAIGTRQNVVSAWKRRGYIPAPQQQKILDAARERDIDLKPADFFDAPATRPDSEARP